MKGFLKVFICFLFFQPLSGKAQGFLKVQGKSIVDEGGNEILLRGVGLGGWMLQEPYMLQLSGIASTQTDIKRKIKGLIGAEKTEAFYNAWLQNHTTKKDIDSMAAWGFNSVRLPMHYNLYTLPVEEEPVAGQNTWLPKGFELTDSLVSWCKSAGLYLILDLHAAPGGQGADIAISDRDTTKPSLWESERAQQKTIALWEKLAQRYKDEPTIGAYDLINEPNWGFTDKQDKNGLQEKENKPLRQLLVTITKAIRAIDTTHIIIIEGNGWGNNYNGFFPLWDDNLVVSFHKYWNHNTTGSIQHFLNIRNEHNVPIWMGESGENSNVWFTDAIALFERNNIGWAWWPLKKLGFNNPLQVPANKDYQQLISYWRDGGQKPSETMAYNALLQLAGDLKIENNICHKDVVDAMIRQPHTTATKGFLKVSVNQNPLVYAVQYDLGRNGYAYWDKDTANYRVSTGQNVDWNKGRTYRNDGVDIEPCTDSKSNGYCVGSIEGGEWLQYTISVEKGGRYNIRLRTKDKGKVQLQANGKNVGPVIDFSNGNNGWQFWDVKNIALPAGTHQIKVVAVQGGFSLASLQFQFISK
jgi:endoglucanase